MHCDMIFTSPAHKCYFIFKRILQFHVHVAILFIWFSHLGFFLISYGYLYTLVAHVRGNSFNANVTDL